MTTPDPMTRRVEERINSLAKPFYFDEGRTTERMCLVVEDAERLITQLIKEVREEENREAVLAELRWLEQAIRDECKPFIQHRIDALTPTDLPDNK